MTEQALQQSPELVQQATKLVIRMNAVSVSLLQRHFRLGYQAGLGLAKSLEDAGIISPPGPDGYRTLTNRASSMRMENEAPTQRELFEGWAIDPYEGGDGGDPGSPASPSIWVFGIEHGDQVNIVQEPETSREDRDYSIEKQLIYPYNRQAFKLLATIHGEPVTNYEQFARLHQPWVRGEKGFLKGNIYPYPCNTEKAWTVQAINETGFELKEDFKKWCDEYRLPAITEAVRNHRPRLFIGVGTGHTQAFSRAYFGVDLPLETHQFAVNGYTKKIRYAKHNGGVFVVIPHLTGGPNGLNSDESIQITGSFIAGLMS